MDPTPCTSVICDSTQCTLTNTVTLNCEQKEKLDLFQENVLRGDCCYHQFDEFPLWDQADQKKKKFLVQIF